MHKNKNASRRRHVIPPHPERRYGASFLRPQRQRRARARDGSMHRMEQRSILLRIGERSPLDVVLVCVHSVCEGRHINNNVALGFRIERSAIESCGREG